MKNLSNAYKVAVLAVVSALTLSSCGDYLEIEPRNIITEDNFWDEKADVEQMVYGCYVRMMSDDVMRRCIVWGEARSENVVNGSADGSDNTSGKMDKSLYDVMRNGIRTDNAYTVWEGFYNVINRCNILTVKAPEVADIDPNFSSTEAQAFVAEVAGLRALCYFYLVRAFNNVPFYFDPVQSEDEVKNLPVTPRDQVLDALIADLESKVGNAYKALPGFKSPASKTYNSNRMTQYGIYALLCDLCLWRGQYDKVNTYADIIFKAKLAEFDELEYSSEIYSGIYAGVPKLFMYPDDPNAPSMTSEVTQKKIQGYPLYTYFSTSLLGNLNSYYYNVSADQGNGFEGLFEINYSNTPDDNGNGVSNSAVGFYYGNWFTKNNISNNGHGILFANSTMSDEADNTQPDPSGEPKNKFFLTCYDVRYYSSFERQSGSGGASGGANYIRKFNAGRATLMRNNTSGSKTPYATEFETKYAREGNWIFYRLTDVMLMKAEALIMQGRYDEAFNLIWVVARRSEIGDDVKTVIETKKAGTYSLDKSKYITSYDNMKKLLLGERQREFLFEGKRWFDLLRFAIRDNDYETLRNAVREKYAAGGSSSDLFPNENSLFFPYNKRELKKVNADGVVIPQNPYYLNGEEDD